MLENRPLLTYVTLMIELGTAILYLGKDNLIYYVQALMQSQTPVYHDPAQ